MVRAPSGASLAVVFQKVNDRFQHTIVGRSSNAAETVVLQSAEGDSAEAWPPSPPLQSLSIETLSDGRRAALLVGMAGRGHWSASIEADEMRTALIFDIACRSTTRPERLLSCYQLGPGFELVHVAAENLAPAPATISRDGEWLAIACPMPGQALGPTWRWRYRVELLPSAG